MKDTSFFGNLWHHLPELPKRLWALLRQPVIPIGPAAPSNLIGAFVDLFIVTAASGTLVGVGSALLPGFLQIDPERLVNWPLFVLMQLSNAVAFAVILYLLSVVPLRIRARMSHLQVMAHGLHAYAILNVLVTILFVLCVNRLIVRGSLVDPTSSADLLGGAAVAVIVFWLAVRLLALPLSRYLQKYYKTVPAFIMGFGAVALASLLNPVMASGYFEHTVEREDFCSAVVSVRYRDELATGEYSRDCLVAKCVASADEDTGRSNSAARVACPVLKMR